MSLRDLKNKITISQSIAPAVRNANVNGTGVDLQGFNSAVAEISSGADVDGTHVPVLEEGDTLGGAYTVVAATDLQGAFSADLGANTVERVGYIGNKRFIRMQVNSGGVTGLAYGANIIRGNPDQSPVA